MARYEHLPIYKQAMDIAIHLEKIVAGFSRYHKYTLSSDLRQKNRDIVLLIVKANNARKQRKTVLILLRNALDELLLLVRLGKEVQAFKSFKAFQFIVERVVSVCKQNEGWLLSVLREAPHLRSIKVKRARITAQSCITSSKRVKFYQSASIPPPVAAFLSLQRYSYSTWDTRKGFPSGGLGMGLLHNERSC